MTGARFLVGDVHDRTTEHEDACDLCDHCGQPIDPDLWACTPDTRQLHPWCCEVCNP